MAVTSGRDGGGGGGGRVGLSAYGSGLLSGACVLEEALHRRNSRVTAIAGFAVAVILLAAGGLLLWGSTTHNTVRALASLFLPPAAPGVPPLNAYGWWKVSQVTYIAAIVSFALGGLALIGSLFALTLGHRPEITHEVIPAAGAKDVTTA